MSHPRLQIFVSSTYIDLKEERQAAVEAILKAGHIPAGMELFAAGSRSQLEVIKRWIDESDVFVLILGHRYGSIEPESRKSYTQVEYEYAISQGKPFFAVVAEDSWLQRRLTPSGRPSDLKPSDLMEQDHPDKLKAFRKLVTGRVCRFFEDVKDIKVSVLESVLDLQKLHQFVGWVRGDIIHQQAELRGHIDALKGELAATGKQAAELKSELATAERRAKEAEARALQTRGPKSDQPDWAAIHKNLESLEIYALEVFDQRACTLIPDDVQKSLRTSTAMDCAYIWRDQLTTGVTTGNAHGVDRFLCQRVVPPLMRLGLVDEGRGTGSPPVTRYTLSQKGRDFFVWFDAQTGAFTLADLKGKVDIQVATHVQGVEKIRAAQAAAASKATPPKPSSTPARASSSRPAGPPLKKKPR